MDNTEAIAIHDNLCRYGLPTTRILMRNAYHRSITLLWLRMQERGSHLTIQHVHSHHEKNTPLNDPKFNERWQLAAADEACEQAHVYPCQTPPALGIERFPIYHQGTYVEKRPSHTLRPFILKRHTLNLESLSQEGALQRAYPIAPNNLKKSLFLPEFLLKFRHKLWLQRLPTLHHRHSRGDYDRTILPFNPIVQYAYGMALQPTKSFPTSSWSAWAKNVSRTSGRR
jgi:hypothetical protein